MGLDIFLCKPKMIEKIDKNDEDYLLLSENPKLNIFEKFAIKKINKYYNLEYEIKKSGYNLDQLNWKCTKYGKPTIFEYFDISHPLYNTYLFLSNDFFKYFDTNDDLVKSEMFKTFQNEHLDLLIEYGWFEYYSFYSSSIKKHKYNLVFCSDFCKNLLTVKIINPKIKQKTELCIFYDKIGYQRKGQNNLFYKDINEDNDLVIDKKTLLEHWELYFSETEDKKENFKKNIIDKFEEGNTFVYYNY